MARRGSVTKVQEATLDKETLEAVMDSLDIDGDGKITKDEFKVPWKKLFPKLSNADYDTAWKGIDKNGDGELSLKELATYYGFDLTKKKGESQEELSDEKIMEALQMQATLAEMQAEKDMKKKEEEEAKKKTSEEKGGSRRGSSTGNAAARERKKSSSGVATIKMPAKVTEDVTDQNVIFLQACELGDEKKILDIFKASAEFDGRMEDDKGEMPLHKLARQGCMECVRELIDRSAKNEMVKTDLNWQDKQGKTPLFYAVEYGHVKIVQLCLDRGSDVMIENINGWTALHTAVNADKLDCAETLLVHPRVLPQKQRLLDASDKNERTALHVASFKSEGGEMVALLLKHGADPMAEDQIGNTGVKLAEKTGRRKSKELLEEHIQAAVKQAMPKIRAVNALKTT